MRNKANILYSILETETDELTVDKKNITIGNNNLGTEEETPQE